jgi:hypothetical protein
MPSEDSMVRKRTLEEEGHIMFYSCDDKEHALGVGFCCA